MAFNDVWLTAVANHGAGLITHAQAHSGARGAAGTTATVGSRVAVTKSVDADGDITITCPFTGLPANQGVAEVSYWSASTGGTYYGGAVNSAGDAQANAAGALTVTVVETSTAS